MSRSVLILVSSCVACSVLARANAASKPFSSHAPNRTPRSGASIRLLAGGTALVHHQSIWHSSSVQASNCILIGAQTMSYALMVATFVIFASIGTAIAGDLDDTYWWCSDLGINFHLASDGTLSVCNSSQLPAKLLKGTWSANADNVTLNIPERDGSLSPYTAKVSGPVMKGQYKHHNYPRREVRASTDKRSGAYQRDFQTCLTGK